MNKPRLRNSAALLAIVAVAGMFPEEWDAISLLGRDGVALLTSMVPLLLVGAVVLGIIVYAAPTSE